MATYVSDGKGNKYERKYHSDGTYTDHYAGKDRGDTVKGNPDANSGYRPRGSSGSSNSKYDGTGNNADSSGRYSNDYRQAMLDKSNLPDGLTRPTDGKFRSTDVVDTEYRQTSTGNIIRIDKLAGGRTHQTLIPNTNWRKTASGDEDLGNIYNRQTSAYGGQTYFDKDMNRPPSGYSTNAASDWLSNTLKQANSQPAYAPTVPTLSAAIPTVPKLTAAMPTVPQLSAGVTNYFNKNYGSLGNYVAGQIQRYNDAIASNDVGLIQRLQADAARVGYSLPPVPRATPLTAQPTAPQAEVPTVPTLDLKNLFEYQPFQYTPPENVSFTSDGSDVWTPTTKTIQNWYDRQDRLFDRYYKKTSMDLDQQNNYAAAAGIVPSMSADDPTMLIRQAQNMYAQAQAAGNKEGMAAAHALAERIRQQYGWGSGGVDGSVTAGLMTMAGQPTYERNYNERAYADSRADTEWEKQLEMQKLAQEAAQFNSEMDYRYANLAADSYGSGGASLEDSQAEGYSLFLAASERYASGRDYLADLERHAGQIQAMVGPTNYAKLIAYATKLAQNSKFRGSLFQAGGSSPVKQILSKVKLANPNVPTSGNVSSWLDQAISATGVGEDWKPYLAWLVSKESSGNPKAKNPTPVNGEHATGLLQILPSTFKANAMSGHTNIYNPVDNAIAAINYIKRRYGHPSRIKGIYGSSWVGY